MAAIEPLQMSVGATVFVKAAIPADVTKAAYESTFASSALQIMGLIDIQVPRVQREISKQGGIDGHERTGAARFNVPDITANIRAQATDTGTDALIAAIASGASIAFKHVDPATGKIDYWQAHISSMVRTMSNDNTPKGYTMTASVPSLSVLNDQTAPS
jgi:hypothetical protein